MSQLWNKQTQTEKKIKSGRFTVYDSIKDQQSPWHMHTHTHEHGRKKNSIRNENGKEMQPYCPRGNDWQWPTQWHNHFALTNQQSYMEVFNLYGNGFSQITPMKFCDN